MGLPGRGTNSIQSHSMQGSDPAAAAAAAAAANSYASSFRNAAINGLHPYAAASYEAAAAAAAACAWAGRLDPSAASLGRLDAASAGFQAGLAASQAAAFRRSGKPRPTPRNPKHADMFCTTYHNHLRA